MENQNHQIETPVSESLVREIITQYNRRKGKYKLNSLHMLTVDEIIEQITFDLNDNNKGQEF